MKFAGYDQIIIQGRAKNLSYLYIDNDKVEIRDASHLQGMDVHQTQRIIKDELDDPDIQWPVSALPGKTWVVCAWLLTISITLPRAWHGSSHGIKKP